MLVNINKPSTVYVAFTPPLPNYFCLNNEKGQAYYFRWMNGQVPRIKFNLPDPGTYTSSTPFSIVKIVPIETPAKYPQLPPPERNRWKNVEVVTNAQLTGTPARIFSETGVIEVSPEFFTYPPPVRMFLLLHEQAHLLYTTEEYCDLFALVNYLRQGYNRSTAYYTLNHILTRTKSNINRIEYLLTQIKVNGDEFEPY